MKDIIFIASYFNMSESEAIKWIAKHTQAEIDEIFNKYMSD